MYSITVKN